MVVAESLEVPKSFISKYETGERRLDVVGRRHVAEALHTTLESVVARLTATQ